MQPIVLPNVTDGLICARSCQPRASLAGLRSRWCPVDISADSALCSGMNTELCSSCLRKYMTLARTRVVSVKGALINLSYVQEVSI